MKRIGVDVGGTNTDAVLVDGADVLGAVKTATTEDVTSGVRTALRELAAQVGDAITGVGAVMIGTTHFVNAVVQRRHLNRAAALRICLPSCASLPPMVDWPQDLAALVDGGKYLVQGGHEYDGRPLMPLDEVAVAEAARQMRTDGVRSAAVTSVFSPLTAEFEERAAGILRAEHPDIQVTLSSTLGRIGLLERENVTILNACLADLANRTVKAFEEAIAESGIDAPLYITQNDGTVASAAIAREQPVFSFASGPTNSMRGAAFLSGIDDAMVLDVGGTTSDVGCLRAGFPREANNVVQVGGVRTLFRMPDLMSIGLGGGTIVQAEPFTVGPVSVGHRLTQDALVFGGDTLTLTDIAVAAGLADIGDRSRVATLSGSLVNRTVMDIHRRLFETVDRMKTDASEVPLLAVGGGAMLAPERMDGISEVVRVEHHAVANAVGAAIAQVSGEVDHVFRDMDRDELLRVAEDMARAKAVSAGADPSTLKVVDMEDLPLAYLPGRSVRARVRVVGDIGETQPGGITHG
ncbi:MAG: hydantoinase/oxoprolinase family protein [Alphaproteobacteria bacterium]|nr:hydantoinase/oxoprolinase family protein [Alphaproteobacteria bacterium]